MKLKQVGVVCVVLVCLAVAVAGSYRDAGHNRARAAMNGSAQVRVACILLPFANVSVDGTILLDNMVYPYISDYQAISAGTHTLTVTPNAGDGPAASIDLDLAADHQYLVVSYGNIARQSDHAILVVDETEAVAGIAADHASIIFLNLLNGSPGLDGYINGELAMENLTYGTAGRFVAPTGEFQVQITPTGMPSMALSEEPYTGLPQTHTVVVMLGTVFNPKIYLTVYTPLDMLSFFNVLADYGEYYDETRDLLTSAGVIEELAGPGPLTVFAPWDSSYINPEFRHIPDVRDDPAKLIEAMRYHIVPENVPPYLLYQRTELPTLQGTPLSVIGQPDDSPSRPHIWINGAARARQDYRVSNGVLYELDGLISPFSQ